MGSNIGAQELIHQIATAINQMDWDAKEMGVKADWSSIVLRVGEERYEEEYIYTGNVIYYPVLTATVQGERTGE